MLYLTAFDLGGIVNGVIDKLTGFLQQILGVILMLLPGSPFSSFIDNLDTAGWIKALNWVVPVGTFVSIGSAWLVAIGIFYAYQVILRWAKAVGD